MESIIDSPKLCVVVGFCHLSAVSSCSLAAVGKPLWSIGYLTAVVHQLLVGVTGQLSPVEYKAAVDSCY